MLKVKVCGLRDNVAEVVGLKPDYIGFIFYPKSKRYVAELPAEEIRTIPRTIQKVGVFVDQELEEVMHKAERFQLNYIQLHGHESIEYCSTLKKMMNIGVIKVFSGNRLPDSGLLAAYGDSIDYYLFDTRNESYGGTGQKFDWTVIADLKLKKPIFLSGGIDLDDLERIHERGINIFAVDVNSKFEIEPGFKDINKIERLLEARKQICDVSN
ncbi:MAG: phosphoribosylanthranilate isomerase [Bacteroidota bacterium]